MALNRQQNIKEQVGEDLWSLFKSLNFHVLEVKRLTKIFSSVLERESFKITLHDGRIFKARCFSNIEEAERVKQLSHFLPAGRFPKTLDSCGKALLIEWIQGERLRVENGRANIFMKAGRIQRTLHNSTLPKHMYRNRHSELRYWQDRLAWKIDYLTEKNLLSSSEADELSRIAKLQSSGSLVIGLTHGDFCLENMILDRQHNLCIVDLERILVTAVVYDIARTIYRWPMNKQQRQAYLRGYGKSSILNAFFGEPSFWLILVIAGSVVFRHRARAPSITYPLNQLKKILEYDRSSDFLNFFLY